MENISNERNEKYGKCTTCNRYNINWKWCKSCDPQILTQGWTSGNEMIDELIKSTQFKAESYNNHNYLQWIPYDDLKNIKEIGSGGFATIFKATWINGDKYANIEGKFRDDRIIALKKLNNSQNISDKFLKEVNLLFLLVFFPIKKIN